MTDKQKIPIDPVMVRAVTLPITNFNPGTARLDGREERLKAMISNMDTHHKTIRSRIQSLNSNPDLNPVPKTNTSQITPQIYAAFTGLQKLDEYDRHALENKRVLVDTLRKYDGGTTAVPPQAFMAPMAPIAPIAPIAPMTNPGTENAIGEGNEALRTKSNIDVSRDPRRR